ncbi:MAG: hypothetical protein ACYDGN_03985 [Acidimicrobiales bacterium]
MHPIERLRWIARSDGESAVAVAAEAAWTLGELAADEPAAVLTASRRLVERQPCCGPLWWACAHLIASEDPFATARRVSAELLSTEVADRVAEALKANFTSSDVLCATPPTALLLQALARHSSYQVRLVASYRVLRHEMRGVGELVNEVTGYELEEAGSALEAASVLLVEPSIASDEGLLVEASIARIVELANDLDVPVWALLGAGRLIPPRLARAASDLAGAELEALGPETVSAAVDDLGIGPVSPALSRVRCPVAPELSNRLKG